MHSAQIGHFEAGTGVHRGLDGHLGSWGHSTVMGALRGPSPTSCAVFCGSLWPCDVPASHEWPLQVGGHRMVVPWQCLTSRSHPAGEGEDAETAHCDGVQEDGCPPSGGGTAPPGGPAAGGAGHRCQAAGEYGCTRAAELLPGDPVAAAGGLLHSGATADAAGEAHLLTWLGGWTQVLAQVWWTCQGKYRPTGKALSSSAQAA